MINPNPNPKMSRDEIVSFRRSALKRMFGKVSERERWALAHRKERMEKTANRIIANNGGTNPILGY